ncbi:MAG: IS1634 family transposase [Planctomycetes bacterium]|nr:IS1634 family transposase [Planctomycetota bacterium]
MHIERRQWKSANGKTYASILLRHSYRHNGKVAKKTIANLTHCPTEDVNAIELALKHKHDLSALGAGKGIQLKEGSSVGAVWVVHEVARRLGIDKALGTNFAGKLALWQVIARVIDQGSRLSAVRLAQVHAACDVLGIRRGFDENDLYENLTWLSQQQDSVEGKLFAARRDDRKPELFLYDVTSAYLEGEQNELAAYGYNRDKKKGKLQIVIGLLCDEMGDPVSTEVFKGNTLDAQTFGGQVKKAVERFGCERVTFVGDRGMIKRGQIDTLAEAGVHYITAITKPQITKLIHDGVLQMSLFDENICEVEDGGVRYILRRNPQPASEIAATRHSKRRSVQFLVEAQSAYLRDHPRAAIATAEKTIGGKIAKLKIDSWLAVQAKGRNLRLVVDEKKLEEVSRLDGCYVIKTDLPESAAAKQVVHDRYKDLANVEWAFRTSKTAHLEVRPVYVRTEENTRAHVLVVMLAYAVVRTLARAWADLDITAEEGLDHLKTLCAMEIRTPAGGSCLRIPEPRDTSQALLQALDLHLPEALPHTEVRVVTRKKLTEQRKKR